MTPWQDTVPDNLRSLRVADWLTASERTGKPGDQQKARRRQRQAQAQWCATNGITWDLFDSWHSFVTEQ